MDDEGTHPEAAPSPGRSAGARTPRALEDLVREVARLRYTLHELQSRVEERALEQTEQRLFRDLYQTVHRTIRLAESTLGTRAPSDCGAEYIDLVELVRLVCSSLVSGAEPRITLRALTPILSTWNPVQLWQVVANLVSNALVHGRSSPVLLSAAIANDAAVLIVEDFGPGVPARFRESIFERGWSSPAMLGGHGLGLWIARELSQELGGTLVLAPKQGPGARFRLTLPLSLGSAPR